MPIFASMPSELLAFLARGKTGTSLKHEASVLTTVCRHLAAIISEINSKINSLLQLERNYVLKNYFKSYKLLHLIHKVNTL
jgi:hypothetical protein